jgi:hypothetical protein
MLACFLRPFYSQTETYFSTRRMVCRSCMHFQLEHLVALTVLWRWQLCVSKNGVWTRPITPVLPDQLPLASRSATCVHSLYMPRPIHSWRLHAVGEYGTDGGTLH